MPVRPPHAVATELRVPFHDCDPLAIVWHGRYFEYLEAGRCALLRTRALDIPDIRQLGFRMVVAEVRCRYNFPLAYGDTVQVTAWFTEREPLIKVAYDVFNVTHARRSARASTRLATTDERGQLLTNTPPAILARLPA